MDKKKIYIIIAILVLIGVLVSVYFYFFKKSKIPDLTTDSGVMTMMQTLQDSSVNKVPDQQKTDILKKLNNTTNKPTTDQKKQDDLMKSILLQVNK